MNLARPRPRPDHRSLPPLLRGALPALLLSAVLVAPPPARAADLVDGFALSAGAFGVLNGEPSGEGGFELRLRPLWEGTAGLPWVLRPAAGAMATTDGALYGYAGFRFELPAGDRWIFALQSAAGVYDRGDEKDLGGSIQFRSGLEASYRVYLGHRVGALFYHLSNAGLERPNPGSESLVLFWSWH